MQEVNHPKESPQHLVSFVDEFYVRSSRGEQLRRAAPLFASKKAGAAFLGYMQQQHQRLQGERGQTNVKRHELVEAHGYDTKYASHILRLGYQGIDYMTAGRFELPMPDEQRELICSVRRGELNVSEVLALAEDLERSLRAAICSSQLPDVPDYDKVNQLLVSAYTYYWKKK